LSVLPIKTDQIAPWHLVCFSLAVLLTSIYFSLPALDGPLILDDRINIKIIDNFNKNEHYTVQLFFQDLHENGKLTRPLSLLTFALQHKDWPSNIYAFKSVNLLIHYLNAFLAGLLTYLLTKKIFFRSGANNILIFFAIACASLWLIHPIQQSTVYYVVQRMALLSGFFMLLGSITYIQLRPQLDLNRFNHFVILSFVIGIILALSILSKGNGLTLVFYLLLLEYFLRKKKIIGTQKEKYFILYSSLVYLIPLLFFIAFVSYKWEFLSSLGNMREFTPWERILTQSRILIDYLSYTLLPDVFYGGLFHDDYSISKGFFSPITTTLCIVAILLMLFLGWHYRTNHPVAFLGVTWFFISHIVESTFIPLELYFEHRNYIAILGMLWLIFYLIFLAYKKYPRITTYTALSYFTLILFFFWNGIQIWSSSHNIVVNWAQHRMLSPRAQNYHAFYWQARGEYQRGLDVFKKTHATMPRELSLRVAELLYNCQADRDTSSITPLLSGDISTKKYHIAIGNLFQLIMNEYKNGKCENLSNNLFKKILLNFSQHPSAPKIHISFFSKLNAGLKAELIKRHLENQGLKIIKIDGL